jgi:hypothetical protein
MFTSLITGVVLAAQSAETDPFEQMGEGIGWMLLVGGVGYFWYRNTRNKDNDNKS